MSLYMNIHDVVSITVNENIYKTYKAITLTIKEEDGKEHTITLFTSHPKVEIRHELINYIKD